VTIPLALAMLAASVGMMYQAFSAPPIQERVVVAVSVFDNETGQAEFDRPVAGLSDLVVEHLTKIDPDRVAVIGNAAVLRQPRNIRNLKAVARNIRADYVLLGQLQRGETGLRFITHFIRLRDEAHLKANRLAVADEKLGGLEAAVVEEFARAVRDHVLTSPPN
jgi:TolB-like protein